MERKGCNEKNKEQKKGAQGRRDVPTAEQRTDVRIGKDQPLFFGLSAVSPAHRADLPKSQSMMSLPSEAPHRPQV